MTCTKFMLWRSGSRNTCDVCTWIGGGRLPTNRCRPSGVSLGGCTIVCTCHDSRSSRCRRSLQCLQVKNRCQKPRLSPRSIFWHKSRNQEEFVLIIQNSAARCSETHRQVETRTAKRKTMTTALIPRWRILPQVLITKSSSSPTLVSCALPTFGKKKRMKTTRTMRTDSQRKNPTPFQRHSECDGAFPLPSYNAFSTWLFQRQCSVCAAREKEKKFRNNFRNRFWQHRIGPLKKTSKKACTSRGDCPPDKSFSAPTTLHSFTFCIFIWRNQKSKVPSLSLSVPVNRLTSHELDSPF